MEEVLPEGWVETEFANLVAHVIGGDWGKDSDYDEKDFVEVYCIRGNEIKNWRTNFGDTAVVRKIKKSSLSRRSLIDGDILLEISGGGPDQPVGRVVLIAQKTFSRLPQLPKVCTNFLKLIRPVAQINSSYFCSFLEYFYYSGEVVKYQGGSNNLRNLKYKEYETIRIPFPSLLEQERIVAKLNKLFAQHEKINETLVRIPQLLNAFRQQVLTQAADSKKRARKLKDFITDIRYGTSKKSEYGLNGTPILRIPNIENGRINDKDLKYSLLDDKEYETLKLRKGDILIIRSNGSVSLVGQSAIITSEHENYSYAGYLIRIRLNVNYEAEYLNYIFKSDFIRSQMIDTSRSTSGVNNINSKEIQELDIPDLEIDEQQDIVERLERLFAKADVIEARYQAVKEKIYNLRQVILQKAFRGELVPQLPDDGDAKDLLASIIAVKEEAQGKQGKA